MSPVCKRGYKFSDCAVCDDPKRCTLGESDEITDGMLRWEPGSLPTTTIERIATDALADLWRDCYRRGDNLQAFQRELFREKVSDIINAAAGEPFEVIKSPRIPRYPKGKE